MFIKMLHSLFHIIPIKNYVTYNNPIDIDDVKQTEKIKKSSITIEINFKQNNDTLAHSILDYITNRPNIQSILYTNNYFKLNHKMPILINEEDEIYVCLIKDISNDADNVSQII
jgi:hypothetical protein